MRQLVTLGVGALGGVGGYLSGIPAGAMLGAMVAVALFNLASDGATALPRSVRIGARILIGTAIGSLLTATVLQTLGINLVWAVVFTLVVLAVGIGSGFVLARVGGIDVRTALLACCPGGMPEMTALADELGAQVDVVVGVHLLRKVLTLVTVAGLIVALGLA